MSTGNCSVLLASAAPQQCATPPCEHRANAVVSVAARPVRPLDAGDAVGPSFGAVVFRSPAHASRTVETPLTLGLPRLQVHRPARNGGRCELTRSRRLSSPADAIAPALDEAARPGADLSGGVPPPRVCSRAARPPLAASQLREQPAPPRQPVPEAKRSRSPTVVPGALGGGRRPPSSTRKTPHAPPRRSATTTKGTPGSLQGSAESLLLFRLMGPLREAADVDGVAWVRAGIADDEVHGPASVRPYNAGVGDLDVCTVIWTAGRRSLNSEKQHHAATQPTRSRGSNRDLIDALV